MAYRSATEVTGFVRADGGTLRNGDGNELLLRGVGFGSWLLPEGYMWRFPEAGDRPRRIEGMIESLIGAEKANQFWDNYYQLHIAEEDIARIAAEGFNSVRLPINARFLLDPGDPYRCLESRLELLDRVIQWCRIYGLYVILDLHGAPGGQTGTNIDDSEFDRPDLFAIEDNKSITIALWRTLADRYKDEWIVAGYDLLNEPLPEWFGSYNDAVMPLYRDIIKAIREVDRRHMIILEGVHWSTDWSIFEREFDNEPIDDNVMLQFHKYWNNPDTESIAKYLDCRERWNVPIYMGEGGENNKDWYTGAFQLFEDHNISWNFWTWKKMDTTNSPCSIQRPEGWELLIDYLKGGDRPDSATASRILDDYLNNMKLSNCDYHSEVVNSLLRRAPLRIPAVFYGYKGAGTSFGSSERQLSSEGGNVGIHAAAGTGFRQKDGTAISFAESGRTTATFEHGGGEEWQSDQWLVLSLTEGDWFRYEFHVSAEGRAMLKIGVYAQAMEGNGELALGLYSGQSVKHSDEGKNAIIPVTSNDWHCYETELSAASAPGTYSLTDNSAESAPGTYSLVLRSTGKPLRVMWLTIS